MKILTLPSIITAIRFKKTADCFKRFEYLVLTCAVALVVGLQSPISLAQSSQIDSSAEKRSEKRTDKSTTKSSSSTDKAKGPTLKIDSLKRDDYVTTACGCAYYAPTNQREDGPMFLWINGKGEAAMKVDGKARSLKVIKEERVHMNSKPNQGKIGSGDKVLMTLQNASLSASIRNTAERNCTIGPDCTTFKWQSTINLSENDARKSVNAWAVCGCPGRKIFRAEEKKETEG